MAEEISRWVKVQNPMGLHWRPADLIVRTIADFDATVSIEKNGERVDANSILSILTLAADQGTELVLCGTGPQADDAVSALEDLFARGFDENESVSPQANKENPD